MQIFQFSPPASVNIELKAMHLLVYSGSKGQNKQRCMEG